MTSFLKHHKISEHKRAKMINWILKVMRIFNQSDETAFRAIYLLDLYFSREQKSISSSELYLLGIIAIFSASKLSETKSISMSQLIKLIGKNQFTIEEIQTKEKYFLMTIGFNLNHPTMNNISNLLLENLDLPLSCKDHVLKYSALFQKMFLHSYDISSEFYLLDLAGLSIIIALKLFAYSNKRFSGHQFYSKIMSLLNLSKKEILSNLSFFRDYISCFKDSFKFSCLNDSI